MRYLEIVTLLLFFPLQLPFRAICPEREFLAIPLGGAQGVFLKNSLSAPISKGKGDEALLIQQSAPRSSSDQLSIKWKFLVWEKFKNADGVVIISPTSSNLIQNFIDKGVARIISEGVTDARIDSAEKNLNFFTDQLIENADMQTHYKEEVTIGPNGRYSVKLVAVTVNNIGEATFSKTTKVCPLYPFC